MGVILSNFLTKDGLLPTREIISKEGGLWLRCNEQVRIWPHWRSEAVTNLLLNNFPEIWKMAAIRVQFAKSIVARAPVYGVPFHRAVEIVLHEGEHKSCFWVQNQKPDNLYSTLRTRLRSQTGQKGRELVFEAWQWIGNGIEVDYAHAVLSGDASEVFHLDNALVIFSTEEDIHSLIYSDSSRKSVSYEKYFRVDAEIPLETSIELMRTFFPIEELVDEYFIHGKGWNDV
jgi:hypothetical protein